MKIFIHIPQLIYAGAEKVLVDFANYLYEHGHDVEIMETYDRGFLKPLFKEGITFDVICSKDYTKKYYASAEQIREEKNVLKKIVLCCKKIFSIIVGYKRFAEKLCAKKYKNKKFDVAINFLETESPDFILKYIKADKYLQWIHIDVSKTELVTKYANLYSKIDSIICVSKYAMEQFVEKYPNLKNKTTYIYNFYNTFEIMNKAKAFDVKFDGDFNILSIGRMTSQKGYIRALSVINRLTIEGYRFKWYIIGSGYEYDAIRDKISELNLNNNVILLGLKDNPYPYIKACDLFFLPSKWEGFPTVTVEAKILDRAALATEVSGIREQITDGLNGYIVENSEKGIYDGLKMILNNTYLLNDLSNKPTAGEVFNNDLKYNKFIKLLEK